MYQATEAIGVRHPGTVRADAPFSFAKPDWNECHADSGISIFTNAERQF